jgi:hypothetical protein
MVPAGTLYPSTKLRDPTELNQETLKRSFILARRAGLSDGDSTRGKSQIKESAKAAASFRK